MSAALDFLDNYKRIRNQFRAKPAPVVKRVSRDVLHLKSEPSLGIVLQSGVKVCRMLYSKPIGPVPATWVARRYKEATELAFVEQAVAFVCKHYDVHPRDLMGPWKAKKATDARAHAWWLIRRNTTWSLPKIAEHFGKDHSTVCVGIQRFAKRMAKNQVLDLAIGENVKNVTSSEQKVLDVYIAAKGPVAIAGSALADMVGLCGKSRVIEIRNNLIASGILRVVGKTPAHVPIIEVAQ